MNTLENLLNNTATFGWSGASVISVGAPSSGRIVYSGLMEDLCTDDIKASDWQLEVEYVYPEMTADGSAAIMIELESTED